MTLTIDLPLDVENALTNQARQQGVTPESLVVENLRRLYPPALAPGIVPEQHEGPGLSPTMALFEQWAREDATDDPEEIARRQREGDELLVSLRDNPIAFRQVDLSDWPDEGNDADEGDRGQRREAV